MWALSAPAFLETSHLVSPHIILCPNPGDPGAAIHWGRGQSRFDYQKLRKLHVIRG